MSAGVGNPWRLISWWSACEGCNGKVWSIVCATVGSYAVRKSCYRRTTQNNHV